MKHLFKGLLALGALGLAACSGTNQYVQSVNLSATTNPSVQVTLTANLNTNQVTLNPMVLQFFNPHLPTQLFGAISISNPSPTVTAVGFTYDFTQALSFANISETTTLPNGTPIPVTGPNSTWLVLQPKGQSASLVYLNIDTKQNKAAVGYTLASDQLNSGALGNLIMSFNLSGLGGTGVAGIYNGNGPGTSGFALFADVSTLFGVHGAPGMRINDATSNDVKLQIEKFLYELNIQRAKINIQ